MGVWDNFGGGTLTEVTCDSSGNLAAAVLSAYGIPSSVSVGGSLADLDIKHMDAMSVIKLSLLEASSLTGVIYDIIVNQDGMAEAIVVGGESGNITDIYHTIQTHSYKEDCSGVMVTGKDPLPEWKATEWLDVLADSQIYNVQDMVDNCNVENFRRYATIVYNDPQLSSDYNDGIDNLYEINDPFETIVGYAKRLGSANITDDTTVTHNTTTGVPLKVGDSPPDLGTLVKPPQTLVGLADPSCWEDAGVGAEGGVSVPIPTEWSFETVRDTTVNKFLGISSVFLIGKRIDHIFSSPKTPEDAVSGESTEENTQIWVTITDTSNIPYVLKEGRDYIVNYDEITGLNPVVVFANNARHGDNAKYGNDCSFRAHPNSTFAQEYGGGDDTTEFEGTVFLFSFNQGILVDELWVVADVETPSITIYDPDGFNAKALEIAESFYYEIKPIVVYDEPAPIAFNGTELDQASAVVDNDPTTTQSFSDTPVEQALDEMDGGGGVSLTMSVLNGSQAATLSDALYDHMNSGNGVEATYVCGPNCSPNLGGAGNSGGVINTISYNYSDSGSYTVSVNEGGKLAGGFAQISGGPTSKATESFSAKGTVVQSQGDGTYFKVRIDGYGERIAINMTAEIIRPGDKVTCSIHNNPVEV